jgi:hypothetical protein
MLCRIVAFFAFAGALVLQGAAQSFQLTNDQVTASWTVKEGQLLPTAITDKKTGETLNFQGELFSVVLTNGQFIHGSEFHATGAPQLAPLAANPSASRFSERLPGQQLKAELTAGDSELRAEWRATLREGSRYVRQEITLTAGKTVVPLKDLMLLETPVANARSTGTVDGCPVVTETMFFAAEHPLSVNRGEAGYVRCFLPRGASLEPGESFACSSVIGFVSKGQLRRGFLAYLERERAHPYRTFLHYNSWYDLGYFSKFDEKGAVGVINAFGEELVKKRGVTMNSFLFDDGWDDYKTLWHFHEGFPNGFGPVREAAEKYGADPGIWLSPWGGYGQPHVERIKYGKEQGFEIRDGNFAMAGPKYYERFRSLCMDVMAHDGINQFKFDGIGVSSGGDDSEAALRDFEAMLRLIAELRAVKPDIYINLTTGTWPSPFWLLHADSIWRGGEDHSFVQGNEPARQRWITYRDNDVYDEVVGRSELYPLNSLMLHGIIYAKHAHDLNSDPSDAFKSEVRDYFGCGTQLQEMYITPTLLTQTNWDDLAEAAKWSRANAETLVDTHWVGGSPSDREVYGWAAWSPKKGILTLRNPANHPKEIKIDAAKVFQLPEDAATKYNLVPAYKDESLDFDKLVAGQPVTFKLQPFQVLVMEAQPVN